jgi:hypothetical protein
MTLPQYLDSSQTLIPGRSGGAFSAENGSSPATVAEHVAIERTFATDFRDTKIGGTLLGVVLSLNSCDSR